MCYFMSSYGTDWVQPPWVYGPKEVNDWIDATHGGGKKGKQGQQKKDDTLHNLHIHFDFNVKQAKVQPSNALVGLLGKITKNELVSEDIDLIVAAELILRALAKAKFRNTEKILVDGNVIYDHPEDTSDLRKTIDLISEYHEKHTASSSIELMVMLDDIEPCEMTIFIKKIHKKKEHTVDLMMKGSLQKTLYHAFVNYLSDKLDLQEAEE